MQGNIGLPDNSGPSTGISIGIVLGAVGGGVVVVGAIIAFFLMRRGGDDDVVKTNKGGDDVEMVYTNNPHKGETSNRDVAQTGPRKSDALEPPEPVVKL